MHGHNYYYFHNIAGNFGEIFSLELWFGEENKIQWARVRVLLATVASCVALGLPVLKDSQTAFRNGPSSLETTENSNKTRYIVGVTTWA